MLQPVDRRSRAPGDDPRAIAARGRWLERGFVAGLVEVVRAAVDAALRDDAATILDVGCGDGWFDERILAGRALDLCGVDLATCAVRLAARRMPDRSWIVANADRGLPLLAASVDLAWSIFGRRPARELARVLRPGGGLVVVVPGEDDLAELREAAQGRAVAKQRASKVVAELAAAGFEPLAKASWRARAAHDPAAVADALAMSYRGLRRSERARLEDCLPSGEPVVVTSSAEVLTFRAPRESAAPDARGSAGGTAGNRATLAR